jgi:hypothetical protein
MPIEVPRDYCLVQCIVNCGREPGENRQTHYVFGYLAELAYTRKSSKILWL